MGRTRGAIAAGVVAAVLLLGSCSGDSGSDEAESEGGGVGDPAADAEQAEPAPQIATQERQIIRTATLLVEVDDVPEATDEAVRITEDAGGLLFTRDSDLEGREQSRLTLKTPPDQLDEVLDAIVDLGDPLERVERAEDVTEQMVDLEGRLSSAQTSADRLRGMLTEASTAIDLVTIEGELEARESEIEAMQGQLQVLTNQVELATINVTLTEDTDGGDDLDVPGFFGSVKTGVSVLAAIVRVTIAVLGFSLPFLVLAAIVWWLAGRKLWERYRSSRRREVPPH